MQVTELLDKHRVDRTLAAPPLTRPESSLASVLQLLFALTPTEARALVRLVKYDHATKPCMPPSPMMTVRDRRSKSSASPSAACVKNCSLTA